MRPTATCVPSRKIEIVLLLRRISLLACLLLSGCGGSPDSGVLRLATTTSTRDSGLLDVLLPTFEEQNRCRVDVVAVGTGAALKLGESGDADVLIVHARDAENAFMDAGHGVRHAGFMVNYFTILGPAGNTKRAGDPKEAGDPAAVRDLAAVDALKKIAAGKHRFLSRSDDSGTHKRELSLWKAAGGRPSWKEYIETGQGMGPTLIMANEMQGYVLTDMGTYLKFKDKIDLVPLTSASEQLRNPYAAIVVNPTKNSRINVRLAKALVDYLISAEAQRQIAEHKVVGQQLFRPTHLESEE